MVQLTEPTRSFPNMLAENPWIELVRTQERVERHFSGKVHAFNTGYARLKKLDYDIIGNLDADISFEPDYFSFLMEKFAEHPQLGVGGTPFREGTNQYDFRYTSTNHVSGACQLFRRKCFETIGGYTPLKMGGVDLMAVMTARMMGWQTRTFSEKTCQHNKETYTRKKIQIQSDMEIRIP
jgi:biofilm PGA synthesis N-glycosyltransferase PgaC